MTLVETTVSISVIVLCLVLGLRFATGFFSSSHNTFSRTVAVQLASEQVEKLKALPWTSLGLFTSEYPTGYPTCPGTCSSEPAVTLGADRVSGSAAPTPRYTVDRGNLTYTVTTWITWNKPASPGGGVKHIVVRVRWTAGGASLSAVSDGLRSPTYSEASSAIAPGPTPTAAPSASQAPLPTGAVAVQNMTMTHPTLCVNGSFSTGFSTKYTETLTVTATNATPYDEVTLTWPGYVTPLYNQPWGQGDSTLMTFILQMPAGTVLQGVTSTTIPITLQIVRADLSTATKSMTITAQLASMGSGC